MALPATMKAAAIDRFGPPSILRIHQLPVPQPGAGEVLIALHGAGVGIWDAMIRIGTWAPDKVAFPYVLGTDGAGVVAAVGPRVRRLKVGDRVWAYAYQNPKGGFYAEYVAVDADSVGRAPKGLDPIEAAAGAVTGLTAMQGVDDHLELERGETVLVLGATGAVGTLALQFARWRRARVIATATGTQAQRFVKRLGADAVLDARAPDAADRLRELAPDGLDAVLAFAGGLPLEYATEQVRPGGTRRVPERRGAGAAAQIKDPHHRVRRRGLAQAVGPARPRGRRRQAARGDRTDVSPGEGGRSARARGRGARAREDRAADPASALEG